MKSKALKTIAILGLNDRALLVRARRSAKRNYFELMDRLCRIRQTQTVEQLAIILNPDDDRFDLTKTLAALKTEITESYRKHIQTYQHPSVWFGIKTIESKNNSQWKAIFTEIPEALAW